MICGLAAFAVTATRATESIPGVTVTARRPLVPVLIGKEQSPLLRVEVTIGKVDPTDVFERNDVRLTSLSFNLAGTDSLGDLSQLGLFTTDGDEAFRFGRMHRAEPGEESVVPQPLGAAAAAATVMFQVDVPLHGGANVFWLTGRLQPSADLLHRIAAACTSVGTSAGTLVPSDAAAAPAQRIGVALRRHQDDGVDTYRIPALTTTAKGSLLCVYDMRWRPPGHDLQDHITTGLSRSLDGGQTWEPMRVVMDMGGYGGLPPEQNGCSDPGIIVDRQTGEIFCFATWIHGKPGHHQWVGTGSEPGFEIGKSAQFMMVRSRDDGVTWTQPENLTRRLKQAAWWLIAPAPNHGIQLRDGTLVMPIQGRDENQREFSTVMSSRDHGATWVAGTPAHRPASECQAAELDDGSVMLNMRNENRAEFYRAVAVTRDLGQTWEAHATDSNTLIEPHCNGSLLRVEASAGGSVRHALLFSNPHTQKGRSHQTVQVSFDDGCTWPRTSYQLLDEELGAGYPTLTQIDAHRVGIVYEGSQADLVFQQLSLDELLRTAGR